MMNDIRRYLVLVTLAAGLLAGCAGNSGGVRPMIAMDGTRMDLQDPVENGRALLVTGQYGLAIEALSRVVHDEPGNVRALNLIAEAYALLHRYDLADRYHAQALEIDPNSVAALNNLGFSHLVRGDRTRAADLLERAAAIDGDQPVVAANLRLAADASAARKEPASSEASLDAMGDVAISDHVVMVRRTGKLVRLAPGVQLLITEASPIIEKQPVSTGVLPPVSRAAAPLPYIAIQQEAASDPRTRVLAALQRLLDPSPFGFFPEVDDFNQMWGAGSGTARSVGQSVAALAS
jgi:tetratricopeptide (TPR) repeat protein